MFKLLKKIYFCLILSGINKNYSMNNTCNNFININNFHNNNVNNDDFLNSIYNVNRIYDINRLNMVFNHNIYELQLNNGIFLIAFFQNRYVRNFFRFLEDRFNIDTFYFLRCIDIFLTLRIYHYIYNLLFVERILDDIR